ncbi:uncharacterized protein CC84DRAFT_584880 [Paraphaeosphaeria sporulosa]|uniref:Secreted protein n=1 Tax=Paraphaeosphaeria sporulosa TaxID=1460663 RepID=A0A177CN06_9PLEO|nr:uncharacterized protein CC84DRAFT_584880 [Paraphaeosphaeria sporulosa]OAG08676.1 hypothetical protein CC84DRAFT_584880 [Paraphaeosphaeria sporulosa]
MFIFIKMLFRNLPAAAVACLVLPAFQIVVHAHSGNREAVRACGVILRDMPERLASSFCSSYAEIPDITSTCTSTKTRKITVTSIASCSATTTASTSYVERTTFLSII